MFELGLRRPQGQPAGDLAKSSCRAGLNDQHLGAAAADVRTHEHHVCPRCQPGGFGAHARCFFHGICLAGQHSLVDKEVIGLDDHAIAGNQAAGCEQHHVSGHDFRRSYRRGFSIPQDISARRHLGAQFRSRAVGIVFLVETQQGAAHYDQQDDGGIHPIAQKGRNNRREDQDEDDWARELIEKEAQRCGALFGQDTVGANTAEHCLGFIAAQAAYRRVRILCDFWE